MKPPLAGRGITVSARKHKNLAWAIRAREKNPGIQVNPHSKQLRAEEAHSRRVHGAGWKERIVAGQIYSVQQLAWPQDRSFDAFCRWFDWQHH